MQLFREGDPHSSISIQVPPDPDGEKNPSLQRHLLLTQVEVAGSQAPLHADNDTGAGVGDAAAVDVICVQTVPFPVYPD